MSCFAVMDQLNGIRDEQLALYEQIDQLKHKGKKIIIDNLDRQIQALHIKGNRTTKEDEELQYMLNDRQVIRDVEGM